VLWMGVMSAYVFMLAPAVDLYHHTYNVSRLVGDLNLVPPRKYFTLGAYTVSTICSIMPALSSSPRTDSNHSPLSRRLSCHRNIPSRAVTCTSRTARTSPHRSILSQATSNRQSDFLLSDRAYNIAHSMQDGRREGSNMGLQIHARDCPPHASLPW
jgi:hypothetical protein